MHKNDSKFVSSINLNSTNSSGRMNPNRKRLSTDSENSGTGENNDGILKGERTPLLRGLSNTSSNEEDEDDVRISKAIDEGVPAVPDGGYGWVIVFAAFICVVVVDGIGNTYGVFLPKYVEAFKVGSSSAAWGGSLLVGVYQGVGPVVAALTNTFGCRAVVISGAIVASAGFALSSLSSSLGIFLFTYGFIGGIGFGLIYLPAVVCVGYYFESKRAFATGIAVCGSGVGTFMLAPIASALLEAVGWSFATLIFSGFILSCSVFGMLMKPLEVQVETYDDDKEDPDLGDGMAEGSGYFMVQLPGGTMERRQKMPLTADPGDHPSFNLDQLVSGAGVPLTSALPTITETKTTESEGKENPETGLLNSTSVAGPKRSHRRSSRVSSEFGTRHLLRGGSFNPAESRHIVRPMSRKDIFYSGSIAKLPEFQSQKNVQEYRQSIMNVPKSRSTPHADDLNAEMSHMKAKPASCACFGSGAEAFKSALVQMMDFSLLKNPVFLLLAISNVFALLGFYVPFVYLVDAAVNGGVPEGQAAFLLSIMGITSTIGKVVSGVLSDMPKVNSLLMNNFCLLFCGIFVSFVPLCTNYYGFVAVAVLFGLFVAGFISLTSIILVDLLGLDNLTNAFGLLMLFRGGASIVGAPLAGAVYDSFQTYDIPFFLAGVFFFLSAAISFIVPCVIKFAPPKPLLQAPAHEHEQRLDAMFEAESHDNIMNIVEHGQNEKCDQKIESSH